MKNGFYIFELKIVKQNKFFRNLDSKVFGSSHTFGNLLTMKKLAYYLNKFHKSLGIKEVIEGLIKKAKEY